MSTCDYDGCRWGPGHEGPHSTAPRDTWLISVHERSGGLEIRRSDDAATRWDAGRGACAWLDSPDDPPDLVYLCDSEPPSLAELAELVAAGGSLAALPCVVQLYSRA